MGYNTTYNLECSYAQNLLNKLHSLDSQTKSLDFEMIEKAITWAKKHHMGQLRKSGEPFYSHPLKVASMIADYSLKTNPIVAGILHDIVEDTPVTLGMIVDNFTWRIAELVRRVTRVIKPDGTKLSVAELLDEAYHANDAEAVLIKSMDRMHNLLTLGAIDKEKQIENVKETTKEFLLSCIFLEKISAEINLKHICQYYFKNYRALKEQQEGKAISFDFPSSLSLKKSFMKEIKNCAKSSNILQFNKIS